MFKQGIILEPVIKTLVETNCVIFNSKNKTVTKIN